MQRRVYSETNYKRIIEKLFRKVRLYIAFGMAVIIILALLFYLSSITPRYLFTIGSSFTVMAPEGFTVEDLYNFESINRDNQTIKTQASERLQELILPVPNNKKISFKYPEIVNLGRPSYLSSDITQNVTFTVKDIPATGLIQIWELSTSIEEFLDTSKNTSNIEYETFQSKKGRNNNLTCYLWEYTYKKTDKTIWGLEAFFDDKPYMYRLSIFSEDINNEKIRSLFEEMIDSVTVK